MAYFRIAHNHSMEQVCPVSFNQLAGESPAEVTAKRPRSDHPAPGVT
jgi:hypothetical protein